MAIITHEIIQGNRYEKDSYLCCFRCDYCGRREKETFEYIEHHDPYEGDLGFCSEECLEEWVDKIDSGKYHDADREWKDNQDFEDCDERGFEH